MSQPPNGPSGSPQWDPDQRRWYFPEGAYPPPPAGRRGPGEPPGHRQGFNDRTGQRSDSRAGGDVDQETVRVRAASDGRPPTPVRPRPSAAGSPPPPAAPRPRTPATPPPPPRTAGGKKRKWPWIVGGVVLLLIIIVGFSGGGDPAPVAGPAPATTAAPAPAGGDTGQGEAAPAPAGVLYEITGSGSANNITYGTLGQTSQANGKQLPWSKTAPAPDGFESFSLLAQNEGGGEIGCRITVNGKVIAENTSEGEYAVVSCSGTSSPFG